MDRVLVREWDDPCLAHRWRLVQDEAHPSWPRHLMRLDVDPLDAAGPNLTRPNPAHLVPPRVEKANRKQGGRLGGGDSTSQPIATWSGSSATSTVIRAGDRVHVEQHTRLIEASFEGVALQPAAMGQTLHVRLAPAAGGQGLGNGRPQIVAVTAIAKGQTRWLVEERSTRSREWAEGRFQP